VWANLLHSEVLAALIGAAAAYLLVVLTDWRRLRRKARKSLPGRIRALRFAAHDLLTHAILPILERPVNVGMDVVSNWNCPTQLGLREIALEVDDLLTQRDRDGVQAICWQLDIIAQQFAEVRRIAEHFHKTYVRGSVPVQSPESTEEVIAYRRELEYARDLVKGLVQTCDTYLRAGAPMKTNDHDNFARQMLEATFAYSRLALNNVILLNGAGAVAFLAFLGARHDRVGSPAQHALIEFATGAALGGLASILAYLGQRFDWELATGRSSHGRATGRLIGAATLSGIASYVLFVLACIAAYGAIAE
jgi:hypothetical protein